MILSLRGAGALALIVCAQLLFSTGTGSAQPAGDKPESKAASDLDGDTIDENIEILRRLLETHHPVPAESGEGEGKAEDKPAPAPSKPAAEPKAKAVPGKAIPASSKPATKSQPVKSPPAKATSPKPAAPKVTPAKTAPPKKPAAPKVTPAKAAPPKKPAAPKVTPAKTAPPKKPAAPKVTPAKTAPPKKPAAPKVTPAKTAPEKKPTPPSAARPAPLPRELTLPKSAPPKATPPRAIGAPVPAALKPSPAPPPAPVTATPLPAAAAAGEAPAAPTAAPSGDADSASGAGPAEVVGDSIVAMPEGVLASAFSLSSSDLPDVGTTVDSSNKDRWSHLLVPSIQWALERGARIRVGERQSIPLPQEKYEATQKYHHQVKLSDDKSQMVDYVAGIPFPFTDESDPDVAIKLIFNAEARVAHDDSDVRTFQCESGILDQNAGLQVERTLVLEHFRRLYFVSRLFHEPKPTWETPEGLRYREMLFPLLEPFDLKGAGITYNRYLDPRRQDDSWVYAPQSRRVRRLSTAQRSEGVFGSDLDLDSGGGWGGNPAWMDWRLLGSKTVLASFHSRNHPGKWLPAPADFMFDDEWEAREVYVVEARPKFAGYALSRRIIYLDRETFLIPYTELYDQDGALWKVLVQQWKVPKPDPADRGEGDHSIVVIPSMTMIDMLLGRNTRCLLPGPTEDSGVKKGWYHDQGEAGGVINEVFDVSSIIETAR